MKKRIIHILLGVQAVMLLFSQTVLAEGTAPTIPILTEQQAPPSINMGVLFAVIIVCLGIGAVIGALVARYIDKKTYIEDYYWNHEDEVNDLLSIKAEKELLKRQKANAEKKVKTKAKKEKAIKPKLFAKPIPAVAADDTTVTFVSKENKKAVFPNRVRKVIETPVPEPFEQPATDPLAGLIKGDGLDYAGREFYYDPKDKSGGVDPFYLEGTKHVYYEE